ncbi:LOW QUALITY PROTEIN: interferon-induced protein with tetratricopeptide repeats 3 [Echinops telfairi]|uniref:LOW QUALITY PROTEIN: interferon-induced protein with tetratricopeptide repeats 3 n=1 Tax=Echinops telfairi TaxID=9371 RepID=A0ABM0ZQ01_ECHTE|nr:LOW QUALITY PROTEIN: interferon-induced protein with tetratricopeptide repeats 3 [Echinops telfairi]
MFSSDLKSVSLSTFPSFFFRQLSRNRKSASADVFIPSPAESALALCWGSAGKVLEKEPACGPQLSRRAQKLIAIMSEITKDSLRKILLQLKCHFTWNLLIEESDIRDLEERVCNQIEFLNTEFKATMYNLLAYVKHLDGQNEAALDCLRQAEELIQQEHPEEADIRSLVTWGNYAWVYYHMGRLSEVQACIDKVKQICEKFSNPYSLECPELDGEEGWTWLKCGGMHNERAKVCFEKALDKKPNDPEFSSGLAIAKYRLEEKPQKQFPVDTLRQAIELNPDNQYVKVLLALKLQKLSREPEGELLAKEAVEKAPHQTDVLRSAAKFYRNKGDLDKAIELFLRALEHIPNNSYLHYQIGYCYKEKIKKLQNAEESVAGETQEMIEELRECAIDYMRKALGKGIQNPNVHPCLVELLAQRGQYREAEECCRMAWNKDAEKQELHQHCGNVREDHTQFEDGAVRHPLQGLQISKKSAEKEKMTCQPQNVAESQLSRNAPNSWYHQGVAHKLKGEVQQAVECYEKELGRLLRNTPTGISSLFLPASELEGDSENMDQRADSSTPRKPPTLE